MKTVLITGANKSIGFEAARQLLKLGYFVYLGSRDAAKGALAADQLKSEGLHQVEVIAIDVRDEGSIKAARQALGNKSGTLDVLINNAGISGGFPQAPASLELTTLRKVFDTNFFGTISVIGAFFDLLKKSDSPRIVNVTSGLASLALHNDPTWKYYKIKGGAYGPSKTALNAYTIALAFELRDTSFKINAVDPGYTATDFNQFRGTGTVEAAAGRIVKCAIMDASGPSGQFFSDDNDPATGLSPW